MVIANGIEASNTQAFTKLNQFSDNIKLDTEACRSIAVEPAVESAIVSLNRAVKKTLGHFHKLEKFQSTLLIILAIHSFFNFQMSLVHPSTLTLHNPLITPRCD